MADTMEIEKDDSQVILIPSSGPSLLPPPELRFPLLDLPIELQILVFIDYFGGAYNITLEYERITMLRSLFHVKGIPPYELLLTSKYVYEHAGPLRYSLFTGRLILHSVFILVSIGRSERFAWLKDHTRTLHFSDSSVHPERWGRYYSCFKSLKRLEIDFPRIKKLENVSLDRILEGKEDKMLVASMDAFQLSIVDQNREEKIEVLLSQRFSLKDCVEGWRGFIKVDIRLNERGMKVLKRQHYLEEDLQSEPMSRSRQLVYANGNVLDAGSHRSMWEWWQAMSVNQA